MRNAVTALLILLPIVFLNAQTEKGSWSLGLGTMVNKSSFETDHVKQNSIFGGWRASMSSKPPYIDPLININFQTSYGYFITDGLMAGVQLGFAYSSRGISGEKDKITNFGLGPQLRKYFLKGSFRPYVGASALFIRTASKLHNITAFPPIPYKTNQNHSSYSTHVGIAFFPYSNFSLDAQFGYSYFISHRGSHDRNKSGQALGLAFGFNFFFAR